MQITVLDNGLQSAVGHNYTINKLLHAELRTRDIPHNVYALHDVDAAVVVELGCIGHFTHELYDSVRAGKWEKRLNEMVRGRNEDHRHSERRTARIFNRSFDVDLDCLPEEVWAKGNIVLFTGLMQHQIVGFARFAERRLSGVSATVICQLMFQHEWLPWRGRARLGKRLYREAFKQLNPLIGRTVFFTTENPLMGDYVRRTFSVTTSVLPVPLEGAGPITQRKDRIRVGFFGYSKLEKGFHLLPEAIAACQARRRDLDFLIQVQHLGEETAIVKADTTLRNMSGVTLLSHILSDEDYDRHTGATDIVLLPYDPERFGMRGSGVFTESVSAGRPVVATRGLWAARMIEGGEAVGEVFSPYTSDALAEAILTLCDDLEERRTQALHKARSFAAEHSIQAYVDALLVLSEQRTYGRSFNGVGDLPAVQDI